MVEKKAIYGVIGGSGFYDFLADSEHLDIDTPFSIKTSSRVFLGKINDIPVAFIPRHGIGHASPPHRVNYRANLFALHLHGVEKVISSTAVGSLREDFEPGDFVALDQFIFLSGRTQTFFDGSVEIQTRKEKKSGVVHTDVTSPYCSSIRECLFQAAEDLGFRIHKNGTYVMTQGPRFETAAEIEAIKRMGGDVVGMTAAHEISLARELDLCYAPVCVITNYAAGIQEKLSHKEVIEMFDKKLGDLKNLFQETIIRLEKHTQACKC